MGRITISLADELETALEAYAQEHTKPVSQVVADALRAFLNAPATPALPSQGGSSACEVVEDEKVRGYLVDLHRDLGLMLLTLNDLVLGSQIQPPHTPPYQLPALPWTKRH